MECARSQSPVDFHSRPRYEWRLRTRTLELGTRTLLMAIVNVTPDSFSGDGLLRERGGGIAHRESATAIEAAVAAVDGGADLIDLGAESTRPDATPLSADMEQRRLLPVLEGLLRARPDAVVSVDTYHAATAEAAAARGAEIINDVSGLLWDPKMAAAVARIGCGLVLMHTRGRPDEWSTQPRLQPEEVVPLVFRGLVEGSARASAAGIAAERIVLDPGFGFGKRGRENVWLLAGLSRLEPLGRPLLIGLSRKGFLGELVRPVQGEADSLRPVADTRRVATIAGNVAAMLAGARVLRVHDLQVAREAAAVTDSLLAGGGTGKEKAVAR